MMVTLQIIEAVALFVVLVTGAIVGGLAVGWAIAEIINKVLGR